MPLGQIAQPRSRDGSGVRIDDPGDYTRDQTRGGPIGRTSDNSAVMNTYTNATQNDGFLENSYLKMEGQNGNNDLPMREGSRYGASRQSQQRGDGFEYETQ